MPRLVTALALALALALPAAGQAPPRTHDVTVDDYFTLAAITQVAMSPDGKQVAYAEGRWQQSTNDRKTDLWVVDVDKGRATRLTADRANDRNPKWGRHHGRLYFLGNRKREGEKHPPYDGRTQVWMAGGGLNEPQAVTRVEDGVQEFDLPAAGQSLFYTTETTATDQDDFTRLRQQFGGLEYGHGTRKVSQLWRLDLQSWRAEKLLDNQRNLREFAVTPDGKKVALITTPDERVITFEGRSRVDVFDVDSRRVTTLPDQVWRAEAPSPYAWLETPAWSTDGSRLAFNAVFDAYPAETIVTEWRDGTPHSFPRPRGDGESLKGYGSPLQWVDPHTLACLTEKQAHSRLRLHDVDGGSRSALWTPGPITITAFSLDAAGDRAAVLLADAEHFPDIYVLDGPDAKPRRLTNVNPQTGTWKLPQVSTVTWEGAGGVSVEGVLQLPPDYQPGRRVPLIVAIHGGPTTAVTANLDFNPYEGGTYLPARGYAVLLPNYRGSTGYGDKFLTDLVGRENDVDVTDILKGADALIERGIADPDRLGVMGWSNGGYLTNCLITKTTRFKAASSGAGILDTVIEWGTNDEPAYPTVFKQGFPWQRPDNYRKTSPTYDLGKVRTPTLTHVGGNDERCPPGHSRMLYRALREYVKVPTELVVYPGEPHGLTKYAHRKAKMEWDLAWFDQYVRGQGRK
jgi:dipeptidyl aminopeptidase/acylaminoacyl peptidase